MKSLPSRASRQVHRRSDTCFGGTSESSSQYLPPGETRQCCRKTRHCTGGNRHIPPAGRQTPTAERGPRLHHCLRKNQGSPGRVGWADNHTTFPSDLTCSYLGEVAM